MSKEIKESGKTLKLVLVGLQGVGKSAAGNTILGREEFESDTSPSSLTLSIEGREREVCGRRVTVVDTPGLFSSMIPPKKLKEEMKTALQLCAPGPHAFLLVIQLGRFTEQEKKVMETLQNLFSKTVNQYTVVLFTYGDQLKSKTIEEFIRKDSNLQQLLQKCGNRYHVFNNEDMENRSQVTELLQKIDEMVEKNGGGCYTMKDETKEEGKAASNDNNTKGLGKLKELRIVLVGKTGAGKSAAGNTILGRKEFESKISPSSVTSQCKKARGEVNGREISVIDTPDLFDTGLSNDDISKKMATYISLSSPGPHVFLVILSLNNRFTPAQLRIMETIQEKFTNPPDMYTMVLFTHGDRLNRTSIEAFIADSEDLRRLIGQCHGGYHVFNNEDAKDSSQVTQLLQKIDKMVAENGGCYYTNEMYKKAEAEIEEKKMEILAANQEKNQQEEDQKTKAKQERDAKEKTPAATSSTQAFLQLKDCIIL